MFVYLVDYHLCRYLIGDNPIGLCSQLTSRQKSNDTHNKKIQQKQDYNAYSPGDTVMLTQNPKKHTIRDVFEVKQNDGNEIQIQKLPNNLFNRKHHVRKKLYTVTPDQIFGVNVQSKRQIQKAIPKRSHYTYDPIKQDESSSDDTDNDDDNLFPSYASVQPVEAIVTISLPSVNESPTLENEPPAN